MHVKKLNILPLYTYFYSLLLQFNYVITYHSQREYYVMTVLWFELNYLLKIQNVVDYSAPTIL